MARLRRVVRGVSPFLEGEFDRVVAAFQDALTSTHLSAGWLHCLAILDRRRYSAPAAKLAYECRALLGRCGQTGTAPWAVRCRLLPQKQVYCCSAVSEVVGHLRTRAVQKAGELNRAELLKILSERAAK